MPSPATEYTALDLQRYQLPADKSVLVVDAVSMRVKTGFLLDGTITLNGQLYIEEE